MRSVVIVSSFLAAASLGLASPAWPRFPGLARRVSNCTNPPVRKEWRALADTEKQSYIDAVLCLQNQSTITAAEFADNPTLGPINRFDDFHAVHHNQTPSIHWVGHFSLWHRYFVAEYEKTLINVCNYTGAQPYWDWSLDVSLTDNYSTSVFDTEIFSPTVGFGGDGPFVEATEAEDPFNFTGMGRLGGGCVQDGPFVEPNFYVNVNQTGPSCLKRDFTPFVLNWFANPANVEHVQSQPDYTSFAYALEGIPSFSAANIHGSGHFGVGGALGTIGNAYNSPGDPIFYLHHGNIDHVLWQWQQQDLAVRLNQVGGPVEPFDYGGVNVTLDFEIDLGALAGSVTLQDVLNTEGGTLCYTYES